MSFDAGLIIIIIFTFFNRNKGKLSIIPIWYYQIIIIIIGNLTVFQLFSAVNFSPYYGIYSIPHFAKFTL